MTASSVAVKAAVISLFLFALITLPGCNSSATNTGQASSSHSSAEVQAPEDVGLTTIQYCDGIAIPSDPSWERSTANGNYFLYDPPVRLSICRDVSGTFSSIEDVRTRMPGSDLAFEKYFTECSSWESDGMSFRLYNYTSEYNSINYVLLGNSADADIAIAGTAYSDDKDSLDTYEKVLQSCLSNVTFDKTGTEHVDKTALQEQVDSGDYSEKNYSNISWKKYTQSLEAAQEVLDDSNATQDDVDNALRELMSAKEGLDPAAGTGSSESNNSGFSKFDHQTYMDNSDARDGKKVGLVCMVKMAVNTSDGRCLVVTLANDDATLSDDDIILLSSASDDLTEYNAHDILTVFGETHEMMKLTTDGGFSDTLPVVVVTSVERE